MQNTLTEGQKTMPVTSLLDHLTAQTKSKETTITHNISIIERHRNRDRQTDMLMTILCTPLESHVTSWS